MNLAIRALLGTSLLMVAMGVATRVRRAPTAGFPKINAGPVALAAPADAAKPSSFPQLAAMLADPNGPKTIYLGAGVWHGDLSIGRSVRLQGAAGAVLEGTGTSTVVTIDADDVQLDNFEIRRSGQRHVAEDAGLRVKGHRNRIAHVRVHDALFGISLADCQHCVLENAHVIGAGEDPLIIQGDGIKLWESHDSVVRGCHVEKSRDMVVWYTKRAVLEDNVVEHSRYGTHFMYAHDTIVRRSRFWHDVVGVFVMYSARVTVEDNVLAGARGAAGMGIGFKESDGIRLTGNWVVGDTTGVYLDRTPRTPEFPVVFERNVLADNDVGLRFHASQEGVRFFDNDMRQNVESVVVEGGGDAMGTEFSGNRWSDYMGYDLDGDGVGDVRHEVRALSSDLIDTHPTLAFFRGTAALELMDTIARAVPLLPTRTLLVDRRPTLRPWRSQ